MNSIDAQLKQLNANIRKKEREMKSAAKKGIRKALNAAAKEVKNTIKPNVPTLKKSTDFRQKGTVRDNIRHRTKVAKDCLSGLSVIRVRRTKGKRMARVSDNTKDRRDPFYWFMVERGTKKMKARPFLAKGEQAMPKARRMAAEILETELKKAV